MDHPYRSLPARNFWRSAVADVEQPNWQDLYHKKFDIPPDAAIATAGSCFAQHLGRYLRRRFDFVDVEPAPVALPRPLHEKFGYGLYSARYGNVYSAAHLRQLLAEALGEFAPADDVWEHEGRFYDPYRPSIEPGGFGSAEEVRALRAAHVAGIKVMLQKCDVFVFTLGMTETWRSAQDGAVYAVCPGTIAGVFDAARHVFRNCGFAEIYDDLLGVIEAARTVNARMKFVLTVSPVPLTATATNDHVVSATTYSKSVLRAVCGELCGHLDDVAYFPSYEMIVSPATRGMFFEKNLRTITPAGVEFVMTGFFAQHPGRERPVVAGDAADEIDEICDDEGLDRLRNLR